MTDIEKYESDIIDILSLAKLAWNCSSEVKGNRRTIETMLNYLLPNFLHKDRIEASSQPLYIDIEDNRMYIRQPDKNRRKKKLLRLKLNHKGFWFYSEVLKRQI